MSGYGWYQKKQPRRTLDLGRFRWVKCQHGRMPPGTVPAGRDRDGQPLFAGRAHHNGDLLPAKVRPDHHGAYVAWGGAEHVKAEYEVLVSQDIAWKYTLNGNIPPQALVVGHTASGEKLYLGRAYHEATISLGKVHPSHRCLYIPYGGKEVIKNEYEIMVLL